MRIFALLSLVFSMSSVPYVSAADEYYNELDPSSVESASDKTSMLLESTVGRTYVSVDPVSSTYTVTNPAMDLYEQGAIPTSTWSEQPKTVADAKWAWPVFIGAALCYGNSQAVWSQCRGTCRARGVQMFDSGICGHKAACVCVPEMPIPEDPN